MPVYTIKCQDCNSTFIVLCPIDQRDDIHVCPKCKSENTLRQRDAANFSPFIFEKSKSSEE